MGQTCVVFSLITFASHLLDKPRSQVPPLLPPRYSVGLCFPRGSVVAVAGEERGRNGKRAGRTCVRYKRRTAGMLVKLLIRIFSSAITVLVRDWIRFFFPRNPLTTQRKPSHTTSKYFVRENEGAVRMGSRMVVPRLLHISF